MKKQANVNKKQIAAMQPPAPVEYKIVTHSACCIIPPQELWHTIQEIRYEYDKSVSRWPPHINLFALFFF